MALNPPTGAGYMPHRVHGEFFCLQREGIEFEVKIDGMGKLKGKGFLLCTTIRLVLLNPCGPADFKAFDLPLALTHHEKFEQPIFGANYFSGQCRRLNSSLPGNVSFKIWFMEGGCQKFLRMVRENLEGVR